MSEGEQDTVEQKETPMPKEVRCYLEATNNRLTQNPTSLDEKIEMWMYLLKQWKYYLDDLLYREQTVFLLLPLLTNCSVFYLQRYQERKQREDLDRAIELAQETIQNVEDSSPKLFEYMEHLGFVLSLRYNLTHSMEDLANTNAVWQRAIANATNDSSKAKYLYALSESYKERYRLLKSHDALEQAIQCLEDAAQLDTSITRNDPLNLLAFMLRERYSLTRDLNDLRRANQAWQESVRLLPLEDPTIPDKLRNIGAIQARIYAITQQRTDLEESIAYWKHMLNQLPDTMTIRAMGCNFLGYCLAMRFKFTCNLEDLNEALLVQEQAVAQAASRREEYTGYLQNLCNILSERYKISPTMEDQEWIREVEDEIGHLEREQELSTDYT